MKKRRMARTIFILAIVGTLVSAQQVSSESVFTAKDPMNFEKLRVRPFTLAEAPSPTAEVSRNFLTLPGDTVETFDVEVEEEKGPGTAKQLVIFAIITAAAAYAVIELMKPDDSERKPDSGGNGKEPPTISRSALVSVPLTRSR